MSLIKNALRILKVFIFFALFPYAVWALNIFISTFDSYIFIGIGCAWAGFIASQVNLKRHAILNLFKEVKS